MGALDAIFGGGAGGAFGGGPVSNMIRGGVQGGGKGAVDALLNSGSGGVVPSVVKAGVQGGPGAAGDAFLKQGPGNSVMGIGSGVSGPLGIAGGKLAGGDTMGKLSNAILGPPILPRLEQAADLPPWARTAINTGVSIGADLFL